jgi:hypothetical protein
MKRKNFTDDQIIKALRRIDAGEKAKEKNNRLKKIVTDQALSIDMLNAANTKKC